MEPEGLSIAAWHALCAPDRIPQRLGSLSPEQEAVIVEFLERLAFGEEQLAERLSCRDDIRFLGHKLRAGIMGRPVNETREYILSGELEVAQLRAQVVELQKRLDFLFRRLEVKYVPELSAEDQLVADALRKGGVLEAVKVYRGQHRVDLDSAKQAVEAIKASMGL